MKAKNVPLLLNLSNKVKNTSFPEIVFLLLVLLLPTQFGKHFVFSFSSVAGIRIDYLFLVIYTTDFLIIVLFLLTLKAWVTNKKPMQTLHSPIVLILCLWFTSLLVTSLFATSLPLSFYGLFKWLELIIFAFLTRHYLSKTKDQAMFVLAATAFFESTLAILQSMHQGFIGGPFYFLGERAITAMTPGVANASLQGTLYLRPYATFSHPNQLAGYLLVVFVVLLFNLSQIKSRLRNYLYFTLVISSVVIILTLSRSSIFLLFCVVLLFICLRVKRKLMPLAAAGVLALVLLFFTPLTVRFFGTSFGDESIQERLILTRVAVQEITARPLLGVGLHDFIPNIPLFYQGTLSHTELQPVHNIFLLILAETGIIGFFCFVTTLALAGKTLLTKTKKNIIFSKESLLVSLLVIVLLGQIDHYFVTLQQTQLLVAFVVGASFL